MNNNDNKKGGKPSFKKSFNNDKKPFQGGDKKSSFGKNSGDKKSFNNEKKSFDAKKKDFKKNDSVKRLHSDREDKSEGGEKKFEKRPKLDDKALAAKKTLDEFLKLDEKQRKQKTNLLGKALNYIKGSIGNYALRSDMSRLLQAILKYGTQEQREEVVKEVKDDLKILSSNIYGHKFIMKIMKYHALKIKDQKERLDFYKQLFFGNMKDMIQQRFSGEVLDYCYRELWNYTEKRFFVQEFYGSSFLWTSEESKMNDSLKDSLDANKDGASAVILEDLNKIIQNALQKRLVDLTIIQKLIIDIFECGNASNVRFTLYDLIEIGAIPLILHSCLGCKVSLYCISYANEKERKMIIRGLSRSKVDAASAEDNIAEGEGEDSKQKDDNDLINNDPHNSLAVLAAQDCFGSAVITYLFKCVDDTVLLNQKILKHFRKILPELLVHPQACKPILYLLTGNSKCLVNSEAIKMFDNLELRKEILRDGVLSKKGQDKIRQELLLSFGPSLATAITENMSSLLTNQHGHSVVKEAITLFPENKDFEKVVTKLQEFIQTKEFNFNNTLTKTTISHAIMKSKEGGFCDVAFKVVKGKCKEFIFDRQASYLISALLKTQHGKEIYKEISTIKQIQQETKDKNIQFLAKVLQTKKEEYASK